MRNRVGVWPSILVVSLLPASTKADALCGITVRVCRSAETRVRSVYKAPPGRAWTLAQEWSPWAVSVDPGSKTIDIRYRYGGIQPREEGGAVMYADTDERTVHHEISACTGNMSRGMIKLDVSPDDPVELTFERARLVRVKDPAVKAAAGYSVSLIARDEQSEDDLSKFETNARSITFQCPGGGVAVFGADSSATGSATQAATAANPSSGPAQSSSAGNGYEKARATPGSQNRQQTTGEQGGPGGASNVDFGPEVHAAAEKACERSCSTKWDECFRSQLPAFHACCDGDRPHSSACRYKRFAEKVCRAKAFNSCSAAQRECERRCK